MACEGAAFITMRKADGAAEDVVEIELLEVDSLWLSSCGMQQMRLLRRTAQPCAGAVRSSQTARCARARSAHRIQPPVLKLEFRSQKKLR
jgi:hypothetical protein